MDAIQVRGTPSVGVRTLATGGSDPLTLEVWYPLAAGTGAKDPAAAGAHDGPSEVARLRDAPMGQGQHPLLVYSHGGYGSRLNSNRLCSHLAAQGYIVAAPDHPGNTAGDIERYLLGTGPAPSVADSLDARPGEIVAATNWLLAHRDFSAAIDGARLGLLGLSLGGWTALALPQLDGRFGAMAIMAPAWGRAPDCLEQNVLSYAALRERIDLGGWKRAVATLILAGRDDALVKARYMEQLFAEVRAPKKLCVLAGFGHVHFADDIAANHARLREMFQNRVLAPNVDFTEIVEDMDSSGDMASERVASATAALLVSDHFDVHLRGARDDPDAVASAVNRLGVTMVIHAQQHPGEGA